jgi:hypothetical protein
MIHCPQCDQKYNIEEGDTSRAQHKRMLPQP